MGEDPPMSIAPGPIHTLPRVAQPTVELPFEMRTVLGRTSVRLHGGSVSLVDHVQKHILHRTARAALVAAFPSAACCDEFLNDLRAHRWHRSRPDMGSDPVVWQYRHIVSRSLQEAADLGFYHCRGQRLVSIDTAGFLVLIDRGTVVTAFIPGIDSDFMMPMELDHRSRHELARGSERRRRRDGDEAYFYEVFRPAIQQVRRFPLEDPVSGTDYGVLKLVLPRASKLDLLSWLGMRARLGHGPIDFTATEEET